MAGAAVAAAAAVVVVVTEGAGPGPEAEPVAAEVVVERVLAATEPTGDAVIHQTTTWGDGSGSTESWHDEVTAAERHRRLSPEGETLLDGGWPEPPGVDEAPHPGLGDREQVTDFGQCVGGLAMDEQGNIYSCDAGELPPQPFHAYRAVNHCRQEYAETSTPLIRQPGWGYLRLYLETGDIVVDGTEEHDGRELIRLRNEDSSYVYLVDPETYLPVQETKASLDGEAPDVTTYERLPRTPENLALLTPPVPEGFVVASTVVPDCDGVTLYGGPGSGVVEVDEGQAREMEQRATEIEAGDVAVTEP